MKCASKFIDCAASGDDIVNEQDMAIADSLLHRKCIADIALSFFGGQIGLGNGITNAFAGIVVQVNLELPGKRAGKLYRLIVAPRNQPEAM